jgi:uncharacterized protein YukE
MSERDKQGERNGEDPSYASSYAIGALIREMASVRNEIRDFQGEVRESFQQLGVRLHKRVKKAEQRVEQLADELEDTKTRDLRAFKRRYNWWKNAALSGLGLVMTGVLTALILRYVFHVKP